MPESEREVGRTRLEEPRTRSNQNGTTSNRDDLTSYVGYDDPDVRRARDPDGAQTCTRTHTDHGPLRPDGDPGVSVTLVCYPFRLWQASLTSTH